MGLASSSSGGASNYLAARAATAAEASVGPWRSAGRGREEEGHWADHQRPVEERALEAAQRTRQLREAGETMNRQVDHLDTEAVARQPVAVVIARQAMAKGQRLGAAIPNVAQQAARDTGVNPRGALGHGRGADVAVAGASNIPQDDDPPPTHRPALAGDRTETVQPPADRELHGPGARGPWGQEEAARERRSVEEVDGRRASPCEPPARQPAPPPPIPRWAFCSMRTGPQRRPGHANPPRVPDPTERH